MPAPTPAYGAPAPSLPAAAGSSGPALVAAGASGQSWPLRTPITMIGSASSCDIQVPGLAPIHAEIRLEDHRYILYDMSGGQTWVNDRQITTANLLKDGFRVRLGAHEFLVRGAGQPVMGVNA
jgi:predicted component of type VI protein secretion system